MSESLCSGGVNDVLQKTMEHMNAHLQHLVDLHSHYCNETLGTLVLSLAEQNALSGSLPSSCASTQFANVIHPDSVKLETQDGLASGTSISFTCGEISRHGAILPDNGSYDQQQARRVGVTEHSEPKIKQDKRRESNFISRFAQERHKQHLSPAKQFVRSYKFDILVGTLIAANCIFVGFQVELGHQHPRIDEGLQIMFSLLFVSELMFRICVDGERFIRKDVLWSLFDTLTVMGSIIEIALQYHFKSQSTPNLAVLRCMRVLRFVRVTRMLRVESFRELRLMMRSILCCLKPFVWTILLLVMEVYVIALIICQATYDALRTAALPSNHHDILAKSFSSLGMTMYTLLALISGGDDWLTYAVALRSVHWVYWLLLLFYVLFTQLALLNVITAIFVDSSMNAALSDKRTLVQEELMREGIHKAELEHIFEEACDSKAHLTIQQLTDYLEDDQVKTYMRLLGIPYTHSVDLVRLLDVDNSGEVEVEEFVKGCFELQSTRTTDTASALEEFRQMMKDVHQLILRIIGSQQEAAATENRKHIDVKSVQNDLFSSIVELKVAGATFKTACGQLEDARKELVDKERSLEKLRENLQVATGDINGLHERLQTLVTCAQSWMSKDLLHERRQELSDLRKALVHQISEMLTAIKSEESGDLHSKQLCSTITTGIDTETFGSTLDSSESVSAHGSVDFANLGIASKRLQLPASNHKQRLAIRRSQGSWGNTQNPKSSACAGPWLTVNKSLALPVQSGDMDPAPEHIAPKITDSVAACLQRKSHHRADEVLRCLGLGRQHIFI